MNKPKTKESNNDGTRVIDLNTQEIKAIISEVVQESFSELKIFMSQLLPSNRGEYKTRAEVAEFFKITLPTLHSWTLSGTLKSYRINGRVLYRADEIEQVLREQVKYVRK